MHDEAPAAAFRDLRQIKLEARAIAQDVATRTWGISALQKTKWSIDTRTGDWNSKPPAKIQRMRERNHLLCIRAH
jgi:hypothetical protein